MRYVEAMFRDQYFKGLPMSLEAAKQRRIMVVFGTSVDGFKTEVKKDIFSKYMFFDLGMGKYLSSDSYYNPSFFFGSDQTKGEIRADSDLTEDEREEFIERRIEEAKLERRSFFTNGYVNILKDKFLNFRHNLLLKEFGLKSLVVNELKRSAEMQNVFQFEFDLVDVEEEGSLEYYNLDMVGLKKFLKAELDCFFEFNLWTIYKNSLVSYNFFNLTCGRIVKGFVYVKNAKKFRLRSKLKVKSRVKVKTKLYKAKKRKIKIALNKCIFRFKIIVKGVYEKIKNDFLVLEKFDGIFYKKGIFVCYFLLNLLFKKELGKKLAFILFLKFLFEEISLYIFFNQVRFLRTNVICEYKSFFSYLLGLFKINFSGLKLSLWNYLNYYSLGVFNMLFSYFILLNLGVALGRICYGQLSLLFDVFCFFVKFERLVLKFGDINLVQWLHKYNKNVLVIKINNGNKIAGRRLIDTNLTYKIGIEDQTDLCNLGYMFFSKKKGFFLMLFGFRYFVKRTKLVSIIYFGKRFLKIFRKIKFLIFFLFEFNSLVVRAAERKFADDKRRDLKLKEVVEVRKKNLEMIMFENKMKKEEISPNLLTYQSERRKHEFELEKREFKEFKIEDQNEAENENENKNLKKQKKFKSAKKKYNYDFYLKLNEFDYKKKSDRDDFVNVVRPEKLSYSVYFKIRKILQILIIKLCFIFYSCFDIIGYFTKSTYKFMQLLLLLFKKFFNNILFYIDIAAVCRKSIFNNFIKYWILYKHKMSLEDFSFCFGFIVYIYNYLINKSKLNRIFSDFEHRNFLVLCSLACEIFKLYSNEFIIFTNFRFFYSYKSYANRYRSNYFWKLFLMNYDLRFDLPSENYLFCVRNRKSVLGFLFKKGKRLRKKRFKWLFLK